VLYLWNRFLDTSDDPDGEMDHVMSAISEVAEQTSMAMESEEDRRQWVNAVQTEALEFLEGLRGARERRRRP
jgi:hypothetical protein